MKEKKKPGYQRRTYHPIPETPKSFGDPRRFWFPAYKIFRYPYAFVLAAITYFSAWLGWLYYRYWRRSHAIVLVVENQSDETITGCQFSSVDTYIELENIPPHSHKAFGMPLIDGGLLQFNFTRPDGHLVKTICEHEFPGRLVILPDFTVAGFTELDPPTG